MKKKILFGLLVLAVAVGAVTQEDPWWRPMNPYGQSAGVGYGMTMPSVAAGGSDPANGELFIDMDGAADGGPMLRIYKSVDTSWFDIPSIDTQTVSGIWTFTNGFTSNGSVTLGDDEIDSVVINGAVSQPIHHDDFCSIGVIQNDDTAESGADTEINLIHTSETDDGYYQFIEQTATLPLALEVAAGCGLDVSGDITANDGHEIKFTRTPLLGVARTLTGMTAFYFEISITIADISTFDGDWATGVMLPETQQNPPQHDGLDTYVLFTLSDDAGDLDVEGDNGGGGETNDDTGVTWADGATHVLRIEITDASTAAYVDGTAITLTNVNAASEWFDTGDPILPFYYHTQGAEGAASGVVINYVEWGTGAI